MSKRKRRVRTFARTASRSMEKKIVTNAKKLKEDPFRVLPEYSDKYSKRYFRRIEKRIKKVKKYLEDTKKLEKLAKKRKLSGAVAGTLLIAHSEKAPYLAVAKFPTGEVTYAKRGKADKEKLIAVQHFDNPILRLLGVKKRVLKKKLHVYSWDNGYISTGREANPPEEFIDFVISKTELKNKDNVASCSHLKPEIVKEKEPVDRFYLRIKWKSADVTFAICEECASKKNNIFFTITRYILQKDISKDFDVDVIGKIVENLDHEKLETGIKKVDEYLSGGLSDLGMIQENKREKEKHLKSSVEKIFVLDGKSYDEDVESFIEALDPNKFERIGLKFILNKVDKPVIVEKVTPNDVLELFWEEHGMDAIESIVDNSETAKKIFSLKEPPSNKLKIAMSYKEKKRTLKQLPTFSSLSSLASFADKVARTYKTSDEEKTVSEIEKRPDNTKGRSLAYAFLLALNKGKDKKWKYSQVEIEYGEYLKDYAKKLLESDPGEYRDTLQNLITASGSSEDIE